jgi:chromosome segregation ATPase
MPDMKLVTDTEHRELMQEIQTLRDQLSHSMEQLSKLLDFVARASYALLQISETIRDPQNRLDDLMNQVWSFENQRNSLMATIEDLKDKVRDEEDAYLAAVQRRVEAAAETKEAEKVLAAAKADYENFRAHLASLRSDLNR